MKKFIVGIIIGVVLGGAAASLVLCFHKEAVPETKPAETEKHELGLHLTKEQQTSAGVVAAKPEPGRLEPEIKAFGRVLDATPLATLLAEIETAQSAANASAREYERLKSLGENAAARTLEAATAAMKRDQAALESARARLLAGWGKSLASRSDLASLTHSLMAQECALARVDVPAGEVLKSVPKAIRLAPAAGDESLRPAELIGPAPSADPQAQGQAFLALIRDHVPAPGTTLAVRLSNGGATLSGFWLPRTAIVQYDSEMYVFVQTGDESFQRKRVEIGPPQREKAFVTQGVSANDQVVVTAAQQLLSEEFKGAGGGE